MVPETLPSYPEVTGRSRVKLSVVHVQISLKEDYGSTASSYGLPSSLVEQQQQLLWSTIDPHLF